MKSIRHIQIKIWPELVGFIPAIIPFERKDSGKSNPLDIDFSGVVKIESSSLIILLIDLLKIIKEKENRKWIFKEPENLEIAKELHALGMLDILMKMMSNQILIWGNATNHITKIVGVSRSIDDYRLISFPIKQFNFSLLTNKRELVEQFRIDLFEQLAFLQKRYGFKIHKFIQILTEMAKNSGDHTSNNAFFGLDICIKAAKIEIKFAFGDLGDGINKNVRNAIQKNNADDAQRAKHLGLVETYHFALTPGETTKKLSKINRGIGMTIIVDLSKDIGLNLSVFDAESRGILTKITNISHSELRKNFYHLGKGRNVGFYYYGELEHKII